MKIKSTGTGTVNQTTYDELLTPLKIHKKTITQMIKVYPKA